MSCKPRTLHSINAMRVLAEFWVIRFHCLLDRQPKEPSMGPIGDDIMSFFFVLSGFVVMYAHEKTDFSRMAAKREFVVSRLKRIYPVFVLNMLFALPFQIFVMFPQMDYCWAKGLCSALQLFMLDGWAGCGGYFTLLGIAWYLSCVIWLWLAFPFIKDSIVQSASTCLWWKMLFIYIAWCLMFTLLLDYDAQTLAGVPILRLGEFLLGCGAALALHGETVWWLAGNRFWLPFTALLVLYVLENTHHGFSSVCLHERLQHMDCSLWRVGQAQFTGIIPPCVTIAEKIPNKYSFVFAATLYGLGRAELAQDSSIWFLHVLQADIFKALGSFSFTLYLSHTNMAAVVKWSVVALFGWSVEEMHDDIMLFWIYVLSFLLHRALVALVDPLCARREQSQPYTNQFALMVEESQTSMEEQEQSQTSMEEQDESQMSSEQHALMVKT